MSVNISTGVVTLTLKEWREEWEMWQSDGAIHERNRIIELLENPYWHNIQSPDIHIDCEMCKLIAQIKGATNE